MRCGTHTHTLLPHAHTHTHVRTVHMYTHTDTHTHIHCGSHNLRSTGKILSGEAEFLEVEAEDVGEDSSHCLVIEGGNGDDVEMSEEAVSDRVASSAWRPHGRHQLEVH